MAGLPHFNRQAAILVFSCCVILPLTLVRRVSALAFSSGLSFAFVMLLLVAMVYKVSTTTPPHAVSETVITTPPSVTKYFLGVAIMVQGYSSQTAAFPMFSELKSKVRNLRSFALVCAATFGVTFVSYATVG